MRKALITLALADAAFVFLLGYAGVFGGFLFFVAYALAFILPFGVAILICRRDLSHKKYLHFGKDTVSMTAPAVPISVLIIIVLSVITSLALALFGMSDDTTLDGNLFSAIIKYAVYPAIFEELLFRYLPLRVLSHKAPGAAIFISAAFFAAVHFDLFQLFYAFVAGAIFMMLDIMTDSVWPSVIIHFINNLLSVLSYFSSDPQAFAGAYLSVLLVLSVIGGINIYLRRGEYRSAFKKSIYNDYF